jgi:hypothetical protein
MKTLLAGNRPFSANLVGLTALCLILLAISSPAQVLANSPHHPKGDDDQFGMSFGGYTPSSTQGLRFSYSVSTSDVSLSCSSGPTIAPVDTVQTNSGSPDNWVLQGSLTLTCSGTTEVWNTGYEYFNASGSYSHGTINSYNALTYPSMSGSITIYYTGSGWELQIYMSQLSTTDTYSYTSSVQGTDLSTSSSANNWGAVETDKYQYGLSYTSSFAWTMDSPAFYVSSSWIGYNQHGTRWTALSATELESVYASPNYLGVNMLGTPGIQAYYGTTYGTGNGQSMNWCISGSCPLVHSG